MDVTSRESISEVKKLIQEKEGKLHILVNKCVDHCLCAVLLKMTSRSQCRTSRSHFPLPRRSFGAGTQRRRNFGAIIV